MFHVEHFSHSNDALAKFTLAREMCSTWNILAAVGREITLPRPSPTYTCKFCDPSWKNCSTLSTHHRRLRKTIGTSSDRIVPRGTLLHACRRCYMSGVPKPRPATSALLISPREKCSTWNIFVRAPRDVTPARTCTNVLLHVSYPVTRRLFHVEHFVTTL